MGMRGKEARRRGSQRREEELSEGREWGGTKGKGGKEEREGFRKEERRE